MRTLDFTNARLDHLEWKHKLQLSLEDHGYQFEELPSSHKECDLGKWLYSHGLEKYGQYSLILELERAHEELHSVAQEIVQLRNSGDRVGAKQEFRAMSSISDKVIALLMELEKQVAAS